jgi:hypothetical protein
VEREEAEESILRGSAPVAGEPLLPITDTGEREVGRSRADEAVGRVAVHAVVGVVGKAVSEEVPHEAADAGVHHRLEEDVLDVLHPERGGEGVNVEWRMGEWRA